MAAADMYPTSPNASSTVYIYVFYSKQHPVMSTVQDIMCYAVNITYRHCGRALLPPLLYRFEMKGLKVFFFFFLGLKIQSCKRLT